MATLENLPPSSETGGSRTVRDGPTVCVFCGASAGKSPAHLEAARKLAHIFHANNVSLVYGGGTFGVMGELARTLVSLSGPSAVHGIIPAALVRNEVQYDSSQADDVRKTIDDKVFGRTTVVKDMHERKGLMAREVIDGKPGSGFVALSGGFGTMEELMEVTTWNQLGIHDRPVILFNIEGYWDGLLQWLQHAIDAGFVDESQKSILAEAKTEEEVMDTLKNYNLSRGRLQLKWER
ncbi:hypothetical protein K461DRAFT_319226 [Myriangium duriaei CBS 260.36]|uniref:Cytokinin riboside 5'-monophosphate phosphoribohydrolase n=1 Tax=Myriangium duriaei CBS 260.36 TaxID=1168546 RepID=A0A9P4J4Z5_9PEZI|nr:hypothetical protein K461DRAFT_319226 [Myriangium duriaei CBS 260.36]